MELRHLRYFVAVAEELHFGRAARRLGIAQPPLSQQIRNLEAELGASLFSRASRRVQLTPVGLAFLTEARATLERSERAVRVARRAIAGDIGRIRFGYVPSSAFHDAFVTLMRSFRVAHPEVDLQLEAMSSGQQVEALRDQRIDAGFLRPPIEGGGDGFSLLPIVREGFVFVLPSAHALATRKKLALSDLAGEPFVLFERERGPGLYDSIIRMLLKAGVDADVRHKVNPMHAVAGLVAAGFGVAVMPASIQRMDVRGVVYRPVPSPHVVEIALTYRSDVDSPSLKLFVQMAREWMRVHAVGRKGSGRHTRPRV